MLLFIAASTPPAVPASLLSVGLAGDAVAIQPLDPKNVMSLRVCSLFLWCSATRTTSSSLSSKCILAFSLALLGLAKIKTHCVGMRLNLFALWLHRFAPALCYTSAFSTWVFLTSTLSARPVVVVASVVLVVALTVVVACPVTRLCCVVFFYSTQILS